jgi:hypothetical protein
MQSEDREEVFQNIYPLQVAGGMHEVRVFGRLDIKGSLYKNRFRNRRITVLGSEEGDGK